MRARLALIAAVGGLALAGAPKALADPIPVAPDDEETFTARVDRPAFQASTTTGAGQITFHVSRGAVFNRVLDTFWDGPDDGSYEARPRSDSDWLNEPDTYYWRAKYTNCVFADPNCFSPVRELTLDPLPAPTQTSPADDATIPYGGQATFSVQDVPTYRRQGTRIYIEFSKRTDRRPNGTFAYQYLLARPGPVGEGVYEYRLTEHITQWPGTYYWIVERWDCAAVGHCYVTDDEIRTFTVEPPVGTPVPDTVITRHPARRTRKRRARFAFVSNLPDASFQCHYTGGWSRCLSPQRFRHLKPGRYRFKVRAVRSGKRDATPATWLFRVLRRG